MTSAAWLAQFSADAHDALRSRARCEVSIAERAAIYGPRPRDENPYTPERPDALRDGLLRGFQGHHRHDNGEGA